MKRLILLAPLALAACASDDISMAYDTAMSVPEVASVLDAAREAYCPNRPVGSMAADVLLITQPGIREPLRVAADELCAPMIE